jgi:hypothetical protein
VIGVAVKAASELEQFRIEKDEFYRHDRRSPLTPDQQRAFTGLSYSQSTVLS